MKTYILTLLSGMFMCISFLGAQQTYDIRFLLDNIDCENNEVCYFVQIRSSNDQTWALAGQNYRIFYDGSKATYKVGSGISLLPSDDYSPFTLTTNVPNTDASAFNGLLPFDKTLGFLNYSIDLMDLASGGISFTSDGEWVSTSLVCFEMVDETINDPNQCLNLIWARAGLTDSYATAFVEVSEWIGQNSTINSEANVYDDLDENDGDAACISAFCGIGTPTENSDVTCSDGVDNDDDGLVDCADPNCESTNPCINTEQQFYGIRLSLESIDCETRQACYGVELKSEGRSSFLLGGQQYRLYYDSEAATFVQGFSEMGQDIFTPFTLIENTENTNSSNIGVLPFDDDLGYLDYSIELSGFQPSTFEIPTNTWMKTSTLCFNLAEEVISEPNTCFNVVWGRDGLTDDYRNSFVEVQEYINVTEGRHASGLLYDDLGSEDGNASCFNDVCSSFENTSAACNDGLDNDMDGLVDCADSNCAGLVACENPEVKIGDFVFEDLNGNGIQDQGEPGLNGITLTIYIDDNSDGSPDNVNDPIAATISANNMDDGSDGNYGFSVPAGNYVIVASGLGQYTITIQGEGTNDNLDSDFDLTSGSSGTLVVNNLDRSNVDLGLVRLASIAGIAFSDDNSDGIAQIGENGISNLIVNLYKDLNNDGVPDDPNNILSTTTTANINGEDGYYEFIGLRPCLYIVEFIPGFGFSSTQQDVGANDNADSDVDPTSGYTSTINLGSGQMIDNIYAGYVAGTAVGDFVWNDADGDGVKDEDELGINGVTVRLYRADGTLVSNTITVSNPQTNESGFYKFTDISAGEYYIELVLEEGLVTTVPNVINNEEIDSDITDANGANTSSTFSLLQGQVICDLDAGVYNGATVEGIVWQDSEQGVAGIYEAGIDATLGEVSVKLLNADNEVVGETTTDENGFYVFSPIRTGSYSIMFVSPDNLSFVNSGVGDDDDIDSEVSNLADGTTNVFFVGVGQRIQAVNAGLQFGTLPVDLISFNGYWDRKADENRLNWSTANEINNEAFEIERTLDLSGEWAKIGDVEGSGNSSSIIDYGFFDENIGLSGTYFYRLKQIDYNGDFEYSDVIAIDVDRIGKAYVKVLENPVSSEMVMEIFTEDNAIALITMFDIGGRLVTSDAFDATVKLQKGKNRIEGNVSALQKGHYFLIVKIAENRYVNKLIKI